MFEGYELNTVNYFNAVKIIYAYIHAQTHNMHTVAHIHTHKHTHNCCLFLFLPCLLSPSVVHTAWHPFFHETSQYFILKQTLKKNLNE